MFQPDEEPGMRTSSPVLSAPIVIPPIIIPDAPTQHVRPYAPYARPVIHTMIVEPDMPPPKVKEEHATQHAIQHPTHIPSYAQRVPSCVCGYTKVLLGFIACPIICSASCLAGTTYTLYSFARCTVADIETLNYRDTFCTCYGCGTAYTTSYRIIESGLRDIRVHQNMSR
jgi:hypothetical protein